MSDSTQPPRAERAGSIFRDNAARDHPVVPGNDSESGLCCYCLAHVGVGVAHRESCPWRSAREPMGKRAAGEPVRRPDPTRITWGPFVPSPGRFRVYLHRRFHRDPTCAICQYGDRSWWMADTPGYFDQEVADAG